MCIVCLRTGKRVAHHVLGGLSRLSTPSWLGAAAPTVENVFSSCQCRAFASLPQPVEEDRHSKEGYVMHPELMNENLRKTQYAVRGEIYFKAQDLAAKGREIIYTNGKIMW